MRTLRRVERGTRPLLLELRRTLRVGGRVPERARPSRRDEIAAVFRGVRRFRKEPNLRAARRFDRRFLSSVVDDLRDARPRFRVSFRTSVRVFRRLRRRDLAFDASGSQSALCSRSRRRSRRAPLVGGAFCSVDELVAERDAEFPFAERRSLFPLGAPVRVGRGRLLDPVERSAQNRRRTSGETSRRDGSQLDFRRTPVRRRTRVFSGVRRDERGLRPSVFLTRSRFFPPFRPF